MSSLILREASDGTTIELHAPIPTPTTTLESQETSTSITTMNIVGDDKITTTKYSNCGDVKYKAALAPSASSSKNLKNTGCASCENKADKSCPTNEDSLATTPASVPNNGTNSTANPPLSNRSEEMLVSSQDVHVKVCETPDVTSSAGVSDLSKIDDCNNDAEEEDEEDDGRIRLGICAMDKKARSKPMAEILSRIDENTYRVVFFGDSVLLNDPSTSWPQCDVLIAFYSKGYPLQKVKEYAKICKPYILNDLDMQEVIQDRRRVYDTLEGSGIDVPRHVYLSRDGYKSKGSGDGNGSNDQDVVEYDDFIVVNGVTIQKPFVEKPVNAENHNISIYYPTTAGGGCKKLFRKIGNRSSEFYPDINEVRRDGSYIYEEFVETQGTDVKMYTVGPGT